MHVYGDIEHVEDASALAREIADAMAACHRIAPGLQRHQALVGAFIRASELVQGAADREFHHIHMDETSAGNEAGSALLLALADAVAKSWDTQFGAPLSLHACGQHLALLATAGTITTRQAEGYAFYALYPESYLAAARRSGLGADTLVIGIRSIGAGLAAMVASGLGAPAALSVRPHGHPFDRHLTIGDRLADRLLRHPGKYAIVDEGPGLSGSSFGSVADWLVMRGVAEARIHFFPSHGGDLGHAAHARHRQRWSRAPKHVVSFEETLLGSDTPAHRLESWIAEVVGPLAQPLVDLSGGAWRQGREHLPADPAMEKRKFLAVGKTGKWLAKYVGLGAGGQAKARLAGRLGAAGFAPQPVALCHGFLVTPWIEASDQPGLVPQRRVLDYLAFRAGLPAEGAGASLAELFTMAAYNIGERFGEEAASDVRAALGDPFRFTPMPCCTDNRMHRWEWVCSGGAWFKLDALDHHAAHDLVGCQDIAWDLAGAAIELDLSPDERDGLRQALGKRIGRVIEPDFLQAVELCYLGFQIGLWTMAQGRNNAAEAERIEQFLERYGGRWLVPFVISGQQ